MYTSMGSVKASKVMLCHPQLVLKCNVLEVSVACDSRVKVVEVPLKHLTAGFVDGTQLTSTCLLRLNVSIYPCIFLINF